MRTAIAIALILGFATGAGMLAAPAFGVERGMWWVTHSQAHGTAQLFGWIGLFTMGVAFHVVPRFRNGSIPFPWPQRVALWATASGVVLRFLSQVVGTRDIAPGVALLGASLILIGIVAFVSAIGQALRSGTNDRAPVEKWVWAGCVWAVVAGLLHLGGVVEMVRADAPIVAAGWQRPLIIAALLGFVGNFIFGVSSRAVVAFLALKPSRNAWLTVAFLGFNVGLAWQVIWERIEVGGGFAGVGAMVVAMSVTLFIAGLRVLESPQRPARGLPGTYFRYVWFIRLGYMWLAVGSAFMFLQGLESATGANLMPALSAAPLLHILTLGFTTNVIFGMGIRMLPLFEGSEIPWHRALDFALVTLNAGVILRLLAGLIDVPGGDGVLGISGGMGLAAFVAFAACVFGAMRPAAREAYRLRASGWGSRKLAGVQVHAE